MLFCLYKQYLIIQVFKLIDAIKLSNISNSNNDQNFLNLEIDNKEKNKPKIFIIIYIISNLVLFNKIIENIKDFCNIYIKNKHIKTDKYKIIFSII